MSGPVENSLLDLTTEDYRGFPGLANGAQRMQNFDAFNIFNEEFLSHGILDLLRTIHCSGVTIYVQILCLLQAGINLS